MALQLAHCIYSLVDFFCQCTYTFIARVYDNTKNGKNKSNTNPVLFWNGSSDDLSTNLNFQEQSVVTTFFNNIHKTLAY